MTGINFYLQFIDKLLCDRAKSKAIVYCIYNIINTQYNQQENANNILYFQSFLADNN